MSYSIRSGLVGEPKLYPPASLFSFRELTEQEARDAYLHRYGAAASGVTYSRADDTDDDLPF